MQERPLLLVQQLAEELGRVGVRYCHWKSNAALARSLSGDNDLDLLIDPRDRYAFGCALDRLGFVQASARRDRRYPGILSFYGHDRDSGRLVHVHAHYRLVLGSDLIKNTQLPLELAFLESARDAAGLPVPELELEYLVFVIRMVLKRRLLPWLLAVPNPAIWRATLLGAGRPPLAGSEALEWEQLRERAEPARVAALREEHLPELSAETFAACERSLAADAPRFAWLDAGRRLGHELRRYRRHSAPRASLQAALRRAGEIANDKLGRQPDKRRLDGTGHIVAFVGGDGSGKTTNVEALQRWLGEDLDARVVHLGKPPWSPLRQAARGFSKAVRLLLGNKREAELPALVALTQVLLARARWQATQRVLALARRGSIVICDRYPVSALRFAESPTIHSLPGQNDLLRRLAGIEEGYYARIAKPDQVVVLRIDPAEAIARKPEDEAGYIRPRLEEIWTADWEGFGAHVVDTSQPLDAVLAAVRRYVWDGLPGWSPLVEIAGPAGAGKSSVVREVARGPVACPPEVRAWSHPLRVLRRIPGLLRFLAGPVPLEQAKLMLVTEVWMDVWKARQDARELPRPTLLDQGPLFGLAYIVAHDEPHRAYAPYQAWLARNVEGCALLLDLAVMLDAPDAVLTRRIRTREQEHEVKAWSDADVGRFFENFRRAFEAVTLDADGRDRLAITRLETDAAPPEELAAALGAPLAPGYSRS